MPKQDQSGAFWTPGVFKDLPEEEFQQWNRKETVLHTHRLEEEQAKVEAEATAKAKNAPLHLQHVDVLNPETGAVEKASYNPANGQYLDQDGKVIQGARLAPRPLHYTGPDGQPLEGWMVGNKLYDQEMQPLPPGTKVFSAWMQPLTTTTESYRSEPQPDGSIKLVPVETTSTRVRGITTPSETAGAPVAKPSAKSPRAKAAEAFKDAGGRIVGGKVPPGVMKSFESYNAAQERWAVMQDALPRALNGDQQAMLNLLANHIGMTMGLQRGARITQGVYNEAEQSAPWLQRVAARFDKNGYLTGVVLTPDQMRQMIDLAKVRLDQDQSAWQREVAAAKSGYGMKDNGKFAVSPMPGAQESKPKLSRPSPNVVVEQ
jgi:hypothetical protein